MSDMKISEHFVWPFALTEEEIATWIALSNRMRGHISVQLDKVAALEDKLEAMEEARDIAVKGMRTAAKQLRELI